MTRLQALEALRSMDEDYTPEAILEVLDQALHFESQIVEVSAQCYAVSKSE